MSKAARAAAEERRTRGARTRKLIVAGALLTMVGIWMALTEDDGYGGWVTLAGLLASIAALHRYGRLGSDGTFDRVAQAATDDD